MAAMHSSRAGRAESPQNRMPIKVLPTAPMPVNTP